MTEGPATRRRSALAAVAIAALLTVALALPASAAGPPKGTYECYDLGYYFTLKGKGKYKVQTGGGGKWKTKGSKVTFKTGPMDFAYGEFRKDSTGAPVIDLYFTEDKSYADNCPKI